MSNTVRYFGARAQRVSTKIVNIILSMCLPTDIPLIRSNNYSSYVRSISCPRSYRNRKLTSQVGDPGILHFAEDEDTRMAIREVRLSMRENMISPRPAHECDIVLRGGSRKLLHKQ